MKNIGKKLIGISLMLFGLEAHAQDTITVYDGNIGMNEVIDIPENMTQNMDSLLSEWFSKTYLDKDEECQTKDENPVFPAEVYIDRLQRMPTIIEMPYNAVVQKFIDVYSGRLRRTVSYMLAASNFYMPIFEEALESCGVPLELKYLPIIESALNPKAVSRVGAVGLWQFMLSTGKGYDLTVNSLVDERRDPIKASYAAARYLKDLYSIFGDWTLVVAAYNCGPGNVNKAIHRAGEVKDYWKIYKYLPQETKGYVPSFIAANYIMNYYCDHNICPMESRLPSQTDTITISKDLYMEQISELCDISMSELQALNPQYRTHLIPGNSGLCTLRLPSTTVGTFISKQDSIYTYRLEDLQSKRRTVTIEESQVSEDRQTGRKNSKKSRNSKRTSSASSRGGSKHTIQKGETLSEIARKNGTTVKKLQKLNGIKGTSIRAGESIKVR